MAYPAGSTPIGGMAVSSDGALYVTLGSGATIASPTFTGVASFAAGTVGAPSIVFAGRTSGWYENTANAWTYATSSVPNLTISPNSVEMGSNGALRWSGTNDSTAAVDNIITRIAAATLGLSAGSVGTLSSLRRHGGNAGYVEWGSVAENLTLSTGGTTTNTSANLLPADSYIEAVTARVTTTVATATSWQVGDSTTAGRFTAAQSGGQLTAGATVVGLVHCDVTGAGGPRQTAATTVRITTVGTPSAGAIRLTSYYRTFVAPTS